MAAAISEVLGEKDGEELVSWENSLCASGTADSQKTVITSSRLTSTCMIHYFKSKMESIIDRGTKVTHEEFASMIEEKIGNDEKAADMKLWNRNAQLGEVSFLTSDLGSS